MKIIDRFFRANTAEKMQKLGLGFYIAKEILKRNNGNPLVKSKNGAGSTFYISLSFYRCRNLLALHKGLMVKRLNKNRLHFLNGAFLQTVIE